MSRYLAFLAGLFLALLIVSPMDAQNTAASIVHYGDPSMSETKCFNIDPTNTTTTDWIVYEFESASTITHFRCWTDVATSTVVMTPRTCDVNAANCTTTEAAMTCGTSRTVESGAIDVPAVAATSTMRVTRGATANSPTQAFLCFTYTIP